MRVWSVFYGNLSLNQGPTTHFSELSNGLLNAGVEVIGFAPALGNYQGPYKQKLKINYIPTLNIPMLRVIFYDFILFWVLLFRFPRPDILYVRVAYFTLFTPLLAKLLRIPLALEINGNVVYDVISKNWRGPMKYIPIWCEGLMHYLAAASICVSETIVKAVHEYYGVALQKLIALQNGVNVDHFKPMDQKACKQELGFEQDVQYVGYVGCFTGWDGIEHIIRAYAAIAQKFPKIKVLLVGDGEHRSFVEAEVKKLGLEDKVIFTGQVPYAKLPVYLNCFSVAVAPYGGTSQIQNRNIKGGLSSLKSLEYSACGLPLVVAKIASIDYVQESDCGFIIGQGDEKALADKVIEILSDTQLAKKFGQNGRAYVVANRSWQSVANTTKAIFEKVLQKG